MRAPPTPAPRKSNAMLNHRPARKEVYSKPPKSKPKPPKVKGMAILFLSVLGKGPVLIGQGLCLFSFC